MPALEEIQNLIPHRPPFLWVDRIISCTDTSIETEKQIPEDHEVFKGHYPGNPITPGVLLCEAIFQSGALLMARTGAELAAQGLVPVLTRINSAKFKRGVYPGDVTRIKVDLQEIISNVSFFKGTLKVNGKTAVQTAFACSMTPSADSR
ncbi:3-hydroxyacyl-ACP dehydratase FabZ [Desulforhopalus sp. IMCC35007]|uniref:3-hydroxyacyl-ACP dehydratase FabZ n=1 Tax=Desulforhopalus sp. IMCC35007 TaxID=2569543 RepID=UPI0010AED2D8|nr:3-hydroxyacyl-ACP dehydratase FabZ [Desulforhopalus sp. IMCC35007]TKB10361.1 beta-hydroxyacyl-ACP dehydratase [Desulforhopalus sp. IMCC35007]